MQVEFFQQVEEIYYNTCGCGKAQHINQKTGEEGQLFLYQRVNRQMGRKVRTDVEHVEGFAVGQIEMIHHFVHNTGNANHYHKHRNCPAQCAAGRGHIAAVQQINADGKHQTVADHGLDVDAGDGNKD